MAGALKIGHAPDLAAAIAGFRLLPAAIDRTAGACTAGLGTAAGPLSRARALHARCGRRLPARSFSSTLRPCPRPSCATFRPTAGASVRAMPPLPTGRTLASTSRSRWRAPSSPIGAPGALRRRPEISHHMNQRRIAMLSIVAVIVVVAGAIAWYALRPVTPAHVGVASAGRRQGASRTAGTGVCRRRPPTDSST